MKSFGARCGRSPHGLDEIPEAGDYTVYEIGDQVGPLRAGRCQTPSRLTITCARIAARRWRGRLRCISRTDKIICPFHGWRWDTSGSNEFVLERGGFRGGKLRDSDVALRKSSRWSFAGFVFINLDPPTPVAFDEFIAPIRHFLEDLAIGEMRHYWWKAIDVQANWKVAQEAFFEGYHVPATHPQLEPARGRRHLNGKPESEVEFNH